MAKYKPNFISLRARLLLATGAVFLLVIALAQLATGYTFMPSKHEGILLSGIPTLMAVVATLALCLALVLTVIDHYDKRNNEEIYNSLQTRSFLTFIIMIVLAPLIQLLEIILLAFGIDIFPNFHGFAQQYTFYTPALNNYALYFNPYLKNSLWILIPAIGLGAIAAFMLKFFPNKLKRTTHSFLFISMLGLSTIWLMSSFQDFMLGEVQLDTSNASYSVNALDEPAKFNAVLLTHIAGGLFMFSISILGIIGVVTNRIK